MCRKFRKTRTSSKITKVVFDHDSGFSANEGKFSGQKVPKNCGGTKRLEHAPAF
jgi:hypothetical protein